MRNFITTAALSAGVLVAVSLPPTWTATLQPKEGSGISGTARVEPQPTNDTTQAQAPTSWKASVSISGAKAGSAHAWQIRQGRCGTDGPVVGTESSYDAIKVDDRGSGTATATVNAALSDRGEYSVSVRGAAPADTAAKAPSPVLACGELRASAEKTPAGDR